MSWFTTYVEHPALTALESLTSNPAIVGNAEAAQAVAEAKASATVIASVASTMAPVVAASAAAAADPVIAAMEAGLQTTMDTALIASLGPVGTVAVPAANMTLTLLEQRVQTYVAALFAHAKTQVAAPKG